MIEIDAKCTHACRVSWWRRWFWRKIGVCFEWLMVFCGEGNNDADQS